jgi:hypothetical protein
MGGLVKLLNLPPRPRVPTAQLNGQLRPLDPEEGERLCDTCGRLFCGHAVRLVELSCPGKHCYHRECFAQLMANGQFTCPKCDGEAPLFIALL